MKELQGKFCAIIAAIVWSFGVTACIAEPGSDVEAAGEPPAAAAATEQAPADAAGNQAMSEGDAEGEGSEGDGHAEGGEHDSGGEGEEGDESGVYIVKSETWDAVRRGARLILSFDEASGAFVGSVDNTTDQTLCAIRVEVHLSTATELGPTPRTDVPAGGSTDVTLSAEGEEFESWTAHPEMSRCGG
jgi:hypothetical protein